MYIVGPLNRITMETVIILTHKAQNFLTANDLSAMATAITTHILINIIT
jgi:hypothetical protein